jgi:hypothetical protein
MELKWEEVNMEMATIKQRKTLHKLLSHLTKPEAQDLIARLMDRKTIEQEVMSDHLEVLVLMESTGVRLDRNCGND